MGERGVITDLCEVGRQAGAGWMVRGVCARRRYLRRRVREGAACGVMSVLQI